MSNIAIKVENPGKRYIIHHEKKESYKTFQDILVNGGKTAFKLTELFVSVFMVVLLCIIGVLHFRKIEKTFADVI